MKNSILNPSKNKDYSKTTNKSSVLGLNTLDRNSIIQSTNSILETSPSKKSTIE